MVRVIEIRTTARFVRRVRERRKVKRDWEVWDWVGGREGKYVRGCLRREELGRGSMTGIDINRGSEIYSNWRSTRVAFLARARDILTMSNCERTSGEAILRNECKSQI